ncbi:hypothetical protein [Nocardiopsis sp. HUAS JQ3]|uniref:hypothetical protein n=1 Tax=Nocardiopsis sp. HUAS JQ3 TaxID=3061629 RepID=UPI0023A9508F|nr:hypothetical protein [Nocardiopsis sp. HUAS JQ3]WDZ91153.1 hypothetical protein PV789_00825 [Nocardiopsis sp. HUAS JQ3]
MSVATELIRARAAGVRAAQQGARRTASPYKPDAPTARERMLWRAWHDGYDSIRPMPVDYSG